MIPLRETRHEQMIMGVFLGVVALLPVVAVFSHRAAAVMVLLMGLAAGTRMEPWRKGTSAFVFRPDMKQPLVLGGVAFILFCLWILLSARWSPQPGGAKLALNVFAPVIGSGVIVWEVLRRPAEKTYRLAKIFAYAVLISLGLLIFEIVSGGPMRDIVPPRDLSPERFKDMTALGRGSTLVMFAAFPAWLILVRRFEHAEKDIGAKRSKLLRYSAPCDLELVDHLCGAAAWHIFQCSRCGRWRHCRIRRCEGPAKNLVGASDCNSSVSHAVASGGVAACGSNYCLSW